jgi:branched-chain amino acid aminotransferase
MREASLLFELAEGEPRLVGEFGEIAAAAAATPPGAYTTLRTWDARRKVLRFGEHLARLEESAALLGNPARLKVSPVAAALRGALARLPGAAEVRVRLTFSPPHLYAALEAFASLPEAARRAGVACVTVAQHRADARCKDTRFAELAREVTAALPAGVHEGLMLGNDGAILEGLSSNFFAVREGVLRTEADRVLPGLTRALVLALARERLPVELRPIATGELASVAESFLTSTSRGVLPVVRIDGCAVGAGRPGPITLELMQALELRIASETEPLTKLAGG